MLIAQMYEKQSLDELTGREEGREAIAHRNPRHRHVPQIQRRRGGRIRKRTQIQTGGEGALRCRERGGRGLRSREELAYLVGAVVIVLVSSGESGCRITMELAEEGRKGVRGSSDCWA